MLKKFCKEQNLKCPEARTIARIIADDPEKMRIFPQKISHFGKIKKQNRQKVLRKPKDLKPEYPGNLVALDTIEKFINGTRRYVITIDDLKEPDNFNNSLMDYLIFYNTERVHKAFQNKLSPMEFMLQWQERQTSLISQESGIGWYYTRG